MRWTERLGSLDRRWIFLGMGLVVLVPMLFPFGLPVGVSPPVERYAHAIDALPRGSRVLLSCDFDPSGSPELVPMARTTFRHLLARDCRVVVIVLWNGGPGLVDSVLSETARSVPGKRYGVDWVDLGYKAGDEAVMVLMGQGVAGAFPADERGTDVRALPLMAEARDYASFALLVSLSEGHPGTREWVQQVGSRFHLPVIAGVTATSAPELYPYLRSGQLRGLLGGMVGAAEYERVRHERGAASRGMDAQSLAHGFVALCLVLGSIAAWATRREERP